MEYMREIGKTQRDCSRNSTRQIRMPGGGNYLRTNGKEFPIAGKSLDWKDPAKINEKIPVFRHVLMRFQKRKRKDGPFRFLISNWGGCGLWLMP